MVVTNVFAVVGEHKRDRGRLLLKGDDGRFYAYGKGQGEMMPVRPGKDWSLDSEANKLEDRSDQKPQPPAS